jgi:hypothetical protein
VTEGPCGICGHLFGTHTLIATDEAKTGGFILCPDCDCFMTWSHSGQPAPDIAEDHPDVIATREHLRRADPGE